MESVEGGRYRGVAYRYRGYLRYVHVWWDMAVWYKGIGTVTGRRNRNRDRDREKGRRHGAG